MVYFCETKKNEGIIQACFYGGGSKLGKYNENIIHACRLLYVECGLEYPREPNVVLPKKSTPLDKTYGHGLNRNI